MHTWTISATSRYAVVAFLMFAVATQSVSARSQYRKAFGEKYPALAQQVKNKNCMVCHGKKNTERSDYAKSLEKALGAKNVKDVKVINAAFDTVAAERSGTDGKTYGDLFKDGTLPPPFKPPAE